MKSTIFTITIIIASITNSNAQNKISFEFETDPLAYAFGGGSGHAAVSFSNQRIQLGYAQLTVPEEAANHENVTESFKAISLKWDYFFGNGTADQGFFAGPTIDYLFLDFEDEILNSHKESQFNLGIRAGYRFDVFKSHKSLSGMYVTPWIGASWFTNTDDINLGGQDYSRKAMTIFPTVHVGWKF